MRRVLLPILTALFILVAACGGSSSSILGSSDPTAVLLKPAFDVTNADAQAHTALIKASDLPGDWKVTEDDFSDDTARDRLKDCAAAQTLAADEAKVRAGRGARLLSRAIQSKASLRISGLVEIYPTPDVAKQFFEKEKALETGAQGLSCYEAIFKAGAPSLKLTTRPGTAIGTPAAGARTFAIDNEVDVTGGKQVVHLELHHWLQENAIISLVVSGDKDSLTKDVVNAALQKQRSAAEDAAAGKH
jgi:hypothetical protein